MNEQEFLKRFSRMCPPPKPLSVPLKGTPVGAAVLVPVIKRGSSLHLIMTRRALHLRHHPGQICFPGGKIDSNDSCHIATALRECKEEIGLEPDDVRVIGTLPNVPSISGFMVKPVVAIVNPGNPWQLAPDEVSEVFEVPVIHFLQHKHFQILDFYRQTAKHQVCFAPYQDYFIWGITAAICYQLHHYLAQ